MECIAVSGGLTAHGTRPRDQFYLTVLSLPENNEFSLVVVRVVNDRHMNKSRFVDYDVIIVLYENDVRYTSDVFAFVWACFLIRKYPVSVKLNKLKIQKKEMYKFIEQYFQEYYKI